ncbi:TonB-dependent receptor domain-containing protein [Sphingomonas montana]|uniref:TonB-dependent receptor domain-containing protein n=1 Tax=Sphingomonas montana TaxID=1843236 RepID=UPI0009F93954|nr:TonB-dependent receptor [Sphingomonas montana]
MTHSLRSSRSAIGHWSAATIGVAALALASSPARAQRANDNAVTAAEDAFGSSIGNETIGLYSSGSVRGFSPVTAGNVRVGDMYFDRQASLNNRLVDSSTIRVGLTAQGYLLPAPTGIVDYRLRGVGDRGLLSVVAGSFDYGGPSIEVDAQLPLLGSRLGVAFGGSHAHEEYYDGSDAHYTRLAVIPRWRPTDRIEIVPFWSATYGRDEEVAPTIVSAGAFLPPQVRRRHYFGQKWASRDSSDTNAGLISKARIGSAWSLAGGIFRSVSATNRNFAELFVDTSQDGSTRELVIADPGQRYASTSGEMRVSRSFVDGPRLHTVHATVRARQVDSLYGGDAPTLDLGPRRLGFAVPVAQPAAFAFDARTRDRVRQTTFGLAYQGKWQRVGELSLGVQQTNYSKVTDLPGTEPSATARDRPILFNAAVAGHVSERLAVYASYTRGLEESGLAPTNAANRNQALPAIRTRQADAGVRWALNARMKLVIGVFDVRKPYFNTDEANRYVVLGDVRHRGMEASIAGNPIDAVSLVGGAVLMQPRVTGTAVDLGRVGKRPLNQPARTLRANAEYRPRFLPGFSVDFAVANISARAASRDNIVSVPAYTLMDIGARYRFRMKQAPAMFRLQVTNVGDTYVWNIVGSDSYALSNKRRLTAYLALDI